MGKELLVVQFFVLLAEDALPGTEWNGGKKCCVLLRQLEKLAGCQTNEKLKERLVLELLEELEKKKEAGSPNDTLPQLGFKSAQMSWAALQMAHQIPVRKGEEAVGERFAVDICNSAKWTENTSKNIQLRKAILDIVCKATSVFYNQLRRKAGKQADKNPKETSKVVNLSDESECEKCPTSSKSEPEPEPEPEKRDNEEDDLGVMEISEEKEKPSFPKGHHGSPNPEAQADLMELLKSPLIRTMQNQGYLKTNDLLRFTLRGVGPQEGRKKTIEARLGEKGTLQVREKIDGKNKTLKAATVADCWRVCLDAGVTDIETGYWGRTNGEDVNAFKVPSKKVEVLRGENKKISLFTLKQAFFQQNPAFMVPLIPYIELADKVSAERKKIVREGIHVEESSLIDRVGEPASKKKKKHKKKEKKEKKKKREKPEDPEKRLKEHEETLRMYEDKRARTLKKPKRRGSQVCAAQKTLEPSPPKGKRKKELGKKEEEEGASIELKDEPPSEEEPPNSEDEEFVVDDEDSEFCKEMEEDSDDPLVIEQRLEEKRYRGRPKRKRVIESSEEDTDDEKAPADKRLRFQTTGDAEKLYKVFCKKLGVKQDSLMETLVAVGVAPENLMSVYHQMLSQGVRNPLMLRIVEPLYLTGVTGMNELQKQAFCSIRPLECQQEGTPKTQ